MASDDSLFDFPPLFQDMRLNIEGGPVYRGGRTGRAAAAYYREKEAIIAIKNKYGNRYGRRIQSYKPDTEAWKPERYRRSVNTLNSHTAEIIPGGLQNKKTLIHIHHDRSAQEAVRDDQQEGFSLRDLVDNKHSSEINKSKEIRVTTCRLSHTVDLAELGRPFKQLRGMMRGKRAVDLSALCCADGKEDIAVNDVIDPDKRESKNCILKEQGSMKYCGFNPCPSEVIESDGKEELTVKGVINPDNREFESCIQKEQGSMKYHRSNHFPSELIRSVENLSTL